MPYDGIPVVPPAGGMTKLTLADLRTRLRRDLRDEAATVFTDTELLDALNAAVSEYSRPIPLETILSFPLTTGQSAYPLPSNMIEFVGMTDANGVVYTITEIFGSSMTISPVPLADVASNIKLRAFHELFSGDADQSTYDAVDDELILLRARARCLELLAGEGARYYRYSEGDVEEDRGKSQKQLRDEADALTNQFNVGLVAARIRIDGLKSAMGTGGRTFAGVINRVAASPSTTLFRPGYGPGSPQ